MGALYGKREHLKRLHPYKVRANTDAVPNRWEWGTLNHECIAGIIACVEYWAELGRHVNPGASTRRGAILAAHEAIDMYEGGLMRRMLRGLAQVRGVTVYGITDPKRFSQRAPTIALRMERHTPLELATHLGEKGIFTWDGNYYALNLTERLDVERSGGFLRIGLVHYNTEEEVDRVIARLQEIAG